MRILKFSIVACFLALSTVTTAADESQILSKEPSTGALHTGETVLVDDGTCPKGQIKEVRSEHNPKQGSGAARRRRCVPDPRNH
jgi:hypothetical protein